MVESHELLRTELSHAADAAAGTPRLTGVHGVGGFNDVEGFNPVRNLYADYMHDIYEGVARYVMTKVVGHIVKKKYIKLASLNSQIREFDYWPKCNVMDVISESNLSNGCLRTTASEMKTLIFTLNLVAGPLVPRDDPQWELYVNLRVICEILEKPAISMEDLQQLSEHIERLLRKFKESDTLKFKFHFLTHYRRIINLWGPLKPISTFRFEAKHQSVKDFIKSTKNRINLLKTSSIYLQFDFAHTLLHQNLLEGEKPVVSRTRNGA